MSCDGTYEVLRRPRHRYHFLLTTTTRRQTSRRVVCPCMMDATLFCWALLSGNMQHAISHSGTQCRHSRHHRHRRTRERCSQGCSTRRLEDEKHATSQEVSQKGRGELGDSGAHECKHLVIVSLWDAKPLTEVATALDYSPMLLDSQSSIMSTVTLSSSTHGAIGSMQAKLDHLPQAPSSSYPFTPASQVHAQQLRTSTEGTIRE